MRLSFFGAAHEVTGSCHLLEACGKNILIDCGMEQGPDLLHRLMEQTIEPVIKGKLIITDTH